MLTFYIKHVSTGRFLHLQPKSNQNDNTKIVFCDEIQIDCKFTFEPVDGAWGYLKHVDSGKYIQPYGGNEKPENFTKLVIHEEASPASLFAIDQINNWLIHKDRKYVHPFSCRHTPEENTPLALHDEVHDNMTFVIVSPDDTNQQVFPKWA
ncbi:unnamed protein product [Meganyctiphanes norvegica]|uniref:Uncharacterized protein n=1 Tax=Meganyctiphanes norvegica TaxID=48144 RepID=A0AAV2SRD0_MEGNR